MPRDGWARWAALALAIGIPLAAAARSPLLQWRDPIYILAGFAGVLGLALILVQPLLILGALPGLPARRAHRWVGATLVALVLIHVGGLWITSPPDVVDVLLFRSPTPFSNWAMLALAAVLAAALLAATRRRLAPRFWRIGHRIAGAAIGIGTVIHAWLITGTMQPLSKALLSLLVLAAVAMALRPRPRPPRRPE